MKIPLGLSFDDVLLVPQRSELSSRSEVELRTEIAPGFFLDIPIVASNMDSITGVNMAVAMSALGGMAIIPRFTTPKAQADQVAKVKKQGARVFAAIGLRDDFNKRAEYLVKAGVDGLLLDLAHAHMTKTLQVIPKIKNKFKLPLIAGTVATYQGAYDLFAAGADTIKVGIGAGSICITRIMAGSGVPQVTAIMEANRAKKQFKNKFIMADAGMKNSGDIVKALAAGASFICTGSLVAGTDEAPGKIIKRPDGYYKEYNGSTSLLEKKREQTKHNGHSPDFTLHVEGVAGFVRYKGPVANILAGLCAGIRSGFSYSGAKNIKQLWKNAQFIQITSAGMYESRAHDVLEAR